MNTTITLNDLETMCKKELVTADIGRILGYLERFEWTLEKLQNADRPLRCKEISEGTDWNCQAISAVLKKMVHVRMVKRVELGEEMIELGDDSNRFTKVAIAGFILNR